jgi:hypothetical protein
VFAAPVSAAMICCVRSAIRADSSLGSDKASSRPLQWSDWYAEHGAIAQGDAAILLSGCCAVGVLPAVWVWKRSCCARGSWPKRSRMRRAQPARRPVWDLLKSLWALKNEIRCPNW